jgi:hypothetical protein
MGRGESEKVRTDFSTKRRAQKGSPPYEGGVAVPTSFVGADGVVLYIGIELVR